MGFQGAQSECLKNLDECRRNCIRWNPSTIDDSCEALVMNNINTGRVTETPDNLRIEIQAMDNLCREGVQSGCQLRENSA